jgi:hypothetical protein
MMKNTTFFGCFSLSLAFHTAFFTLLSLPLQRPALLKIPKKPIEVSYVQDIKKKSEPVVERAQTQRKKEPYQTTLDAKTENSLWKTHSMLQEFLKNENIAKTPTAKPFSEKQAL